MCISVCGVGVGVHEEAIHRCGYQFVETNTPFEYMKMLINSVLVLNFWMKYDLRFDLVLLRFSQASRVETGFPSENTLFL